jgi:hypothetical protein
MLSISCTCTHGGGGHAERCPFFMPTREAYDQVRSERDRMRASLDGIDQALKRHIPHMSGVEDRGWLLAEDVRTMLELSGVVFPKPTPTVSETR